MKNNKSYILRCILYFISCFFIQNSYSETLITNTLTTNTLRVLTWSGHESYLPRNGGFSAKEFQYLNRFAEENGFTLKIISIDKFSDLIPTLLAGQGDLIAGNYTVTPLRKRDVQFTRSIAQTTEYLVMSNKAKPLNSGADLKNKTVYVQSGTAYALTAQSLARVFPNLSVKYVDQRLSNEDLLDKVADGTYELTILDSNILSTNLSYRDDIKKSLQANSKRDLAWAVRPGSNLLHELDQFIKKNITRVTEHKKPKTAWGKIKQQGVIRFALLNGIASYYIWRGELHGFNYDLARSFAKENNLRYEILVAPDNIALLNYVEQGKADIALSFLTPTEQREKLGIEFSRPYHFSHEVLISRSDDEAIKQPADLNHRTLAVRASSSFWQTAKKLQSDYPHITVQKIPEEMRTESIIEGVADGIYDLTIADSHLAELEINLGEEIKTSLVLSKKQPQSWAVKKDNDELLTNVNKYIKKYYKGLFYNVTYNKYFKNIKRIENHHEDINRFRETGQFSPYDPLVDKYAKKYGFDTHLLISQMYQESQFDTNAKSFAGARGLFQVMPATARQLGLTMVYTPDIGVHAGVKYLKWVEERLSYYTIQPDQRIWFALAAYNAGAGHVTDAIKLAKQQGWRTDIWFNHVEKAMLLLSQQKYARKARYGFVRGREPVTYVRRIKRRYHAYQHEAQIKI